MKSNHNHACCADNHLTPAMLKAEAREETMSPKTSSPCADSITEKATPSDGESSHGSTQECCMHSSPSDGDSCSS